jgi:hypothetical protein
MGPSPPTYLVVENDAEDIKAHPFFQETKWESLCNQPPPFLPRILENQSITKYFDEESGILGECTTVQHRRPRDKVLRDPVLGPVARDIRMLYSFPGYEWRRRRVELEKH